jgi:hypothetical protein
MVEQLQVLKVYLKLSTTRGNITTGVTGVNAATDLAEFDAILAEFDAQGAIEENMMFVNRSTSSSNG